MTRQRRTSDTGLLPAEVILTGIVYELRELVMQRGVRSEEMIRVSGFFESAKALWIEMVARDSIVTSAVAHRLRILADICPPELPDYRSRLRLAQELVEESDRRGRKRA
jgi:hypothetical protein